MNTVFACQGGRCEAIWKMGIQTPMAQGWSSKILSTIKWSRNSRLSIKNSLSLCLPGLRVGGVWGTGSRNTNRFPRLSACIVLLSAASVKSRVATLDFTRSNCKNQSRTWSVSQVRHVLKPPLLAYIPPEIREIDFCNCPASTPGHD